MKLRGQVRVLGLLIAFAALLVSAEGHATEVNFGPKNEPSGWVAEEKKWTGRKWGEKSTDYSAYEAPAAVEPIAAKPVAAEPIAASSEPYVDEAYKLEPMSEEQLLESVGPEIQAEAVKAAETPAPEKKINTTTQEIIRMHRPVTSEEVITLTNAAHKLKSTNRKLGEDLEKIAAKLANL